MAHVPRQRCPRATGFRLVLALAFSSWCGIGTTKTARAETTDDRLNILFIAVDDLRPELGCYGESIIQTPEIDRLASRSVVFQRAYCQVAVCNPSRVSLMTGLRPDTTRVWDLVTRFRQTVPDAVTLPQQLKQHGYYAASFGKIFHNPWPDNDSWSEPHAWPESRQLWSDDAKQRLAQYRTQMRAEGRSENAINRLRPQATEKVELRDEQHVDGAIAKQAVDAMRRLAKQDQPFFLAAGFVRPHLPFVVPKRYWEMYDPDQIRLAENAALPDGAPDFSMNTMYELRDYVDFVGTSSPHEGSLSESQQRRLKHGYYAAVTFIDTLVGQLIAEVDRLGLADKTAIVLWGDHGWKLGEHNSWCKQTNHEIDARVPLIIHVPGAEGNGRDSKALVELLDLYPTLCEIADVPIPAKVEGMSLKPLLANPGGVVKQAAFSQFRRTDDGQPLMGYSMRTDRYRYTEWINRRSGEIVARELYDHLTDGQENDNVADRSENSDRIAELHRDLWSRLPEPPVYVPPKRSRPRATFQNDGSDPLTLWWIKPDGSRIRSGVIAPGERTGRNTTLGHVFQVTSEQGFDRRLEVTRRQQTWRLNQ
ncbi:MAG: sulfatase [Rubripirellula sp.]